MSPFMLKPARPVHLSRADSDKCRSSVHRKASAKLDVMETQTRKTDRRKDRGTLLWATVRAHILGLAFEEMREECERHGIDIDLCGLPGIAEAKRAFTRSYLERLMISHDGRVGQAAEAAQVTRQGLHDYLTRYSVDPADYRKDRSPVAS